VQSRGNVSLADEKLCRIVYTKMGAMRWAIIREGPNTVLSDRAVPSDNIYTTHNTTK
jgi:hypothetical protein